MNRPGAGPVAGHTKSQLSSRTHLTSQRLPMAVTDVTRNLWKIHGIMDFRLSVEGRQGACLSAADTGSVSIPYQTVRNSCIKSSKDVVIRAERIELGWLLVKNAFFTHDFGSSSSVAHLPPARRPRPRRIPALAVAH